MCYIYLVIFYNLIDYNQLNLLYGMNKIVE